MTSADTAVASKVLKEHQDLLTSALQLIFEALLPDDFDAKDISFAYRMLNAMFWAAKQRVTKPLILPAPIKNITTADGVQPN